jgi:hypothetical protein
MKALGQLKDGPLRKPSGDPYAWHGEVQEMNGVPHTARQQLRIVAEQFYQHFFNQLKQGANIKAPASPEGRLNHTSKCERDLSPICAASVNGIKSSAHST